MISVEEYEKMEGDVLPYTTDWDFTIQGIDVECCNCEKQTEDDKYKLNEFTNALDIVAVGVCYGCKIVTTGKPMRVYRDGRVTWRDNDGTWKERVEPLIERLRRWRKKWLSF